MSAQRNVINSRWELFHVSEGALIIRRRRRQRWHVSTWQCLRVVSRTLLTKDPEDGKYGEFCECSSSSPNRSITRCRDLCSSFSTFVPRLRFGFQSSETAKHTLVIAHHRLWGCQKAFFPSSLSALLAASLFLHGAHKETSKLPPAALSGISGLR